jgi:hypothetical protein
MWEPALECLAAARSVAAQPLENDTEQTNTQLNQALEQALTHMRRAYTVEIAHRYGVYFEEDQLFDPFSFEEVAAKKVKFATASARIEGPEQHQHKAFATLLRLARTRLALLHRGVDCSRNEAVEQLLRHIAKKRFAAGCGSMKPLVLSFVAYLSLHMDARLAVAPALLALVVLLGGHTCEVTCSPS